LRTLILEVFHPFPELTYIGVHNIIRIGAEGMTLANWRRRATARRILRRTRTAVHVGSTDAVRRGALIQAQIDGAVAVIAQICKVETRRSLKNLKLRNVHKFKLWVCLTFVSSKYFCGPVYMLSTNLNKLN